MVRMREIVGRLEEINGHGRLTGRVWAPDGTKWVCHFKQDQRDRLPEAWMRTVRVIGGGIIEEGKERILDVSSLVVIDSVPDEQSSQSEVTFWESQCLDELAHLQGVHPVDDLNEISDLWPEDDDPEELLSHILTERVQRRHLAAEDTAP